MKVGPQDEKSLKKQHLSKSASGCVETETETENVKERKKER